MKFGKGFQTEDVIISLRNLSLYCSTEGKIDDIEFFLEFYNKTLDVLKIYGEAVGNSYILEKLKVMPELDYQEIDNYINREGNYYAGGRAGLGYAILKILRLTKEELKSEGKARLDEISSICDHMLFTIENPMFLKEMRKND